MTELETRLPCPVCIGTRMEKVGLVGGATNVDCCRRCGGVWFEQGEVHRVGRLDATRTMRRLGASLDVSRAPCHGCHAPLGRDTDTCPACGHDVHLDCPACRRTMAAVALEDMRLDVCRSCRGVWFDRHEIVAIWSDQVRSILAARRGQSTTTHSNLLLVDALSYSPDVVFYGIRAAGDLGGSAGGALAGAADAVGAAAEVAGDVAAGVLEVVAGIIGGFFS